MEQEITATAPVVRESMASVAKDVQEVSASTAAVERDAHVLMEETRPLIVKTIKDADQLTRSSQQVIDSAAQPSGAMAGASRWSSIDGRRQRMSKVDLHSEAHIQQGVALRWFMTFLTSRRQHLASIGAPPHLTGLHEVILFG